MNFRSCCGSYAETTPSHHGTKCDTQSNVRRAQSKWQFDNEQVNFFVTYDVTWRFGVAGYRSSASRHLDHLAEQRNDSFGVLKLLGDLVGADDVFPKPWWLSPNGRRVPNTRSEDPDCNTRTVGLLPNSLQLSRDLILSSKRLDLRCCPRVCGFRMNPLSVNFLNAGLFLRPEL